MRVQTNKFKLVRIHIKHGICIPARKLEKKSSMNSYILFLLQHWNSLAFKRTFNLAISSIANTNRASLSMYSSIQIVLSMKYSLKHLHVLNKKQPTKHIIFLSLILRFCFLFSPFSFLLQPYAIHVFA